MRNKKTRRCFLVCLVSSSIHIAYSFNVRVSSRFVQRSGDQGGKLSLVHQGRSIHQVSFKHERFLNEVTNESTSQLTNLKTDDEIVNIKSSTQVAVFGDHQLSSNSCDEMRVQNCFRVRVKSDSGPFTEQKISIGQLLPKIYESATPHVSMLTETDSLLTVKFNYIDGKKTKIPTNAKDRLGYYESEGVFSLTFTPDDSNLQLLNPSASPAFDRVDYVKISAGTVAPLQLQDKNILPANSFLAAASPPHLLEGPPQGMGDSRTAEMRRDALTVIPIQQFLGPSKRSNTSPHSISIPGDDNDVSRGRRTLGNIISATSSHAIAVNATASAINEVAAAPAAGRGDIGSATKLPAFEKSRLGPITTAADLNAAASLAITGAATSSEGAAMAEDLGYYAKSEPEATNPASVLKPTMWEGMEEGGAEVAVDEGQGAGLQALWGPVLAGWSLRRAGAAIWMMSALARAEGARQAVERATMMERRAAELEVGLLEASAWCASLSLALEADTSARTQAGDSTATAWWLFKNFRAWAGCAGPLPSTSASASVTFCDLQQSVAAVGAIEEGKGSVELEVWAAEHGNSALLDETAGRPFSGVLRWRGSTMVLTGSAGRRTLRFEADPSSAPTVGNLGDGRNAGPTRLSCRAVLFPLPAPAAPGWQLEATCTHGAEALRLSLTPVASEDAGKTTSEQEHTPARAGAVSKQEINQDAARSPSNIANTATVITNPSSIEVAAPAERAPVHSILTSDTPSAAAPVAAPASVASNANSPPTQTAAATVAATALSARVAAAGVSAASTSATAVSCNKSGISWPPVHPPGGRRRRVRLPRARTSPSQVALAWGWAAAATATPAPATRDGARRLPPRRSDTVALPAVLIRAAARSAAVSVSIVAPPPPWEGAAWARALWLASLALLVTAAVLVAALRLLCERRRRGLATASAVTMEGVNSQRVVGLGSSIGEGEGGGRGGGGGGGGTRRTTRPAMARSATLVVGRGVNRGVEGFEIPVASFQAVGRLLERGTPPLALSLQAHQSNFACAALAHAFTAPATGVAASVTQEGSVGALSSSSWVSVQGGVLTTADVMDPVGGRQWEVIEGGDSVGAEFMDCCDVDEEKAKIQVEEADLDLSMLMEGGLEVGGVGARGVKQETEDGEEDALASPDGGCWRLATSSSSDDDIGYSDNVATVTDTALAGQLARAAQMFSTLSDGECAADGGLQAERKQMAEVVAGREAAGLEEPERRISAGWLAVQAALAQESLSESQLLLSQELPSPPSPGLLPPKQQKQVNLTAAHPPAEEAVDVLGPATKVKAYPVEPSRDANSPALGQAGSAPAESWASIGASEHLPTQLLSRAVRTCSSEDGGGGEDSSRLAAWSVNDGGWDLLASSVSDSPAYWPPTTQLTTAACEMSATASFENFAATSEPAVLLASSASESPAYWPPPATSPTATASAKAAAACRPVKAAVAASLEWTTAATDWASEIEEGMVESEWPLVSGSCSSAAPPFAAAAAAASAQDPSRWPSPAAANPAANTTPVTKNTSAASPDSPFASVSADPARGLSTAAASLDASITASSLVPSSAAASCGPARWPLPAAVPMAAAVQSGDDLDGHAWLLQSSSSLPTGPTRWPCPAVAALGTASAAAAPVSSSGSGGTVSWEEVGEGEGEEVDEEEVGEEKEDAWVAADEDGEEVWLRYGSESRWE